MHDNKSCIPTLEEVYEADRLYFEQNPQALYGARLPHPDEWPVPYAALHDKIVVISQVKPGIRTRFLMEQPGSWQRRFEDDLKA